MAGIQMRAARRDVLVRLAIALALVTDAAHAGAQETLFVSRLVARHLPGYVKGIEGPAVDASGTLYVANFGPLGTIGKLAPGATGAVQFAELPGGSIGNGIRIDRDGRMYVADFARHNIFMFELGGSGAPRRSLYFESNRSPAGPAKQPNDLAIAADGTLYASDPDFRGRSGRIWRITRAADGTGRGEVMTSDRASTGVTNGIDLSPDGRLLYVSESATRELWSYRLDGTHLREPRLLKRFDNPPPVRDSELDGLRTDVDGNIYVTRPATGLVTRVSADGGSARHVRLLGKNPSNLTFGGPDGRTVFITQVDGGFIESFRVDRPGREPCLQMQVPAVC